MNRSIACRLAATLIAGLMILLAMGCSANTATNEAPVAPETGPSDDFEANPLATAAAQATAIVSQAQATAMILQAQTEARATVQAVQPSPATQDEAAEPAPTASASAQPQPTAAIPVEVLSVGFAAEGGLIQVRFRAPVDVADRWLQGHVYLIDEANGHEYKEIPVMPRIGPLIGKPVREGQPGYVMLINGPELLSAGATVTVVLGEHVEQGWTVAE